MKNEPQHIDRAMLRLLYEYDRDYMLDMFAIFLENAAQNIAALNGAYHQNDWPMLARHAHHWRSELGMVGLTDLSGRLERVETACKAESPEAIHAAYQAFEDNKEAAIAELKDFSIEEFFD